ncbi:MAG: DUF4393 domain-containing protein [Desulfuromonas sp.]|nr:DUF4393 domain-containing protein [Desulfuromonas sp.]
MSDDEKKLSIALPGEWALQKTLGPVLAELGDDLRRLYAKGRDKIIEKAYQKIDNPEDGKSANLRIAHDVLTNGAFTEEEICAEYFGGVLASSRTNDGKNDDSIQFIDTIKSLSSKQLRLHYYIYNSFNKLLIENSITINVGMGSELSNKEVWLSSNELKALGINIDTDFNIIHRQGLIESYSTNYHKIGEQTVLPYAKCTPTTYGVLLYAVSHNKLSDWRKFTSEDFGDLEGIQRPKWFAFSLDDFMKVTGAEPPRVNETGR